MELDYWADEHSRFFRKLAWSGGNWLLSCPLAADLQGTSDTINPFHQ